MLQRKFAHTQGPAFGKTFGVRQGEGEVIIKGIFMVNVTKALCRSLTGVCVLALTGGTVSAATPVSVSVGGFFTQSLVSVDADTPTGEADIELEDMALNQNGEVHFDGKTTLDDGTQIGFRVELEAEQSDDQIDEHYIYAKGIWGKLIVGAENGVGHLGEVTGPRFVPGLKAYNNSLTNTVIEKAYDVAFGKSDVIEDAHMSTKLEHISGDANKLSYFTPRLIGLQLGFSLTPNNVDKNGGKSNFGEVSSAKQKDIVEYSASYSGKFNGGGFKFGATSVSASNTDASKADPSSRGVGLHISYGDVTVGGNVTTYENLGSVSSKYESSKEVETAHYALTYKLNRSTTLGIGITNSEETRQNGTHKGSVEYQELMIGGGSKLAPGISLGYFYQATKASTAEKKSKEVGLLGMTLALKF